MIPALLFLGPLLAVFPTGLLAWWGPRASRATALLGMTATLGLALAAGAQTLGRVDWPYELGGWAAPWGIEVRLTPFACFWTAALAALALAALWVGPRERSGRPDLFEAGVLLFTGSAAALALDRDLFDAYVWVELALLAAGLLAAREGAGSFWAAFRLVFFGSAGASFLLLGVLYLYSGTGTLDLDDLLAQLLIAQDDAPKNFHALVGFGGFWVTLGLSLPLMFPTPALFSPVLDRLSPGLLAVLAPLAGRVAALSLFIFYFSGLGAPGYAPPRWLDAVAQAAAVFFLSDLWFAARERTWTRAAAFLCVAPLGYVLAGFTLGTSAALQGAVLELACELPALAGLFYFAQWLQECAGTDEVGRLRGLGRRAPGVALAFLALGAGLVGLPPFGGFYAKLYVFEAALRQQQWWLALGSAAAYGFGLFAWGALAWRVFQRPSKETASPRKRRPALAALLALLALAGLGLGLWHQALLRDVITPALPKAFQHWTPPLEDWGGKDVE